MRVLPDRHVGPLQAGRRPKSRHARLRIHPSARLRGWSDTDADVDTNADAHGDTDTHTDTDSNANRDTNTHRDSDSVAHWWSWRGDGNADADRRGAGAHDTGSRSRKRLAHDRSCAPDLRSRYACRRGARTSHRYLREGERHTWKFATTCGRSAGFCGWSLRYRWWPVCWLVASSSCSRPATRPVRLRLFPPSPPTASRRAPHRSTRARSRTC